MYSVVCTTFPGGMRINICLSQSTNRLQEQFLPDPAWWSQRVYWGSLQKRGRGFVQRSMGVSKIAAATEKTSPPWALTHRSSHRETPPPKKTPKNKIKTKKTKLYISNKPHLIVFGMSSFAHDFSCCRLMACWRRVRLTLSKESIRFFCLVLYFLFWF